ncbi:subtilisin-like protease SBT3.9 [Typha angustifolia]|uniref:subtilisin-like protease SBT3.9 n=1 Tax=Typha angustifolia TaxID=59011 RepID=UPI003C2F96A3
MDSRRSTSVVLLLSFLCLHCFQSSLLRVDASSKLYIVYLGEKKHQDPNVVTASHHDMLTSLLGSKEEALSSIVYSYKHGFSGFAAMLTESQAAKLAVLPDVVSIKPNRYYKAHTTRSWDFLGLSNSQPGGLLEKAKYGEGVIVGVVDSGIWPESKSFDDSGYDAIPPRWKGVCQTGDAFDANNCSKKIIGARWYTGGVAPEDLKGEFFSPRDFAGHGTHTASTAAGGLVSNVSFHGLGAGEARGGAPHARLAIYKACWGIGISCGGAALMAAVDDAIHDGVDILSLSLTVFYEMPGTLHAVANGITVVFSAGNDGPAPQTVSNAVPWVITVAASTIDRTFPTVITLGNSRRLVGQSIYRPLELNNSFTELVYGSSCDANSLNNTDVVGKIVLCYALLEVSLPNAVSNVVNAGGVGLIFAQYTVNLLENVNPFNGIPCVLVDFEIARNIFTYLETTSNPLVKVSPTTNVVGNEVLSPKVAAFSSRGPSAAFPGVLKPDIAAPGVSILAATGNGYQFNSGTSMACPHVSGVAALLKSLHPDWSPAAIKSAIVTTASVVDAYDLAIEAEGTPRKLADPFDFGGGHIDPNRAADPGLVYDIDPKDYIKFFNCNLEQSDRCDSAEGSLYYLNLPSVAIPNLKDAAVSVSRTVTNVGPENAKYKAVVEPPPGVKMTVEPPFLTFNAHNKVETFNLTFVSTRRIQGDYTFGSLTWSDDENHSVRIPIAIRTVIEDFYSDTA